MSTYPSGIEYAGTSLPSLHKYPTGIEHVGMVAEVEIKIETMVCWEKSSFVSHTKHIAEATKTDLLHS